jgi:hypothetical protein
MSELSEFQKFPKLHRLNRDIIITEKLDGTNSQVIITEEGQVLAGSRHRFITPEDDNYGFAQWVACHENELREGLGVGRHYGEWYGRGIQRNYGMTERKFALFHATRWMHPQSRPECCDVVPILFKGAMSTANIDWVMARLAEDGSSAVPGFMQPEGIVVHHTAANVSFKITFEHDATGKPE